MFQESLYMENIYIKNKDNCEEEDGIFKIGTELNEDYLINKLIERKYFRQ